MNATKAPGYLITQQKNIPGETSPKSHEERALERRNRAEREQEKGRRQAEREQEKGGRQADRDSKRKKEEAG